MTLGEQASVITMPMDAQFQLGFELTNILNPASQAVSTISSIASIDAVRKAGSDVITEIKLASLLGRFRIDPIVETHFRQAVAKSERTLISRYLEIFLEPGAGPTVQNALKDTALFSMIVQMSLLCSVHEHQPLANAMVKAAERNVRDFKGDPKAVPDFVSLLGTMRVIQRETVAFQWSGFFDSVERAIQDSLSNASPRPKPVGKRRKPNKTSALNVDRHSIEDRGLPFPVLQALLLALDSLQHFDEERQIHIECGTGITTLVVWCFHVLGLSVKVSIEDHEIIFGNEPFNVSIKEIVMMKSSVSLIVPLSQDQPLFTLESSEGDPKIGPELRAKLLNFGRAALMEADVGTRDMVRACHMVIAGALAALNRNCSCFESRESRRRLSETHEAHCNRGPRRFPGKFRILAAARKLFGLHEIDEKLLKEINRSQATPKARKAYTHLVPLLLSLSRIHHQDLERCAEVPFSIKVYLERLNSETSHSRLFDMEFPDVTESFGILANYLLGNKYSDSFIEQALLVSDRGWSLFFDVIDATDPSDVSICNLRMLAGVPSIEDASKDRVIKDRILDGPTELSFSYSKPTILHRNDSSVKFFSGVSTARRGNSLVGFCDNDAFLATQSFTWKFRGTEAKVHILGFREMLELCNDFTWLSPCTCDDKTRKIKYRKDGKPFHLKGSDVHEISPSDLVYHELSNSEYAVSLLPLPYAEGSDNNDEATWMFHVTGNPAARWLQMDDMVRNNLFWEKKERHNFIRGHETCVKCALRFIAKPENQHQSNLLLL